MLKVSMLKVTYCIALTLKAILEQSSYVPKYEC